MQINITYDSSVNDAPAAFKTDVVAAVEYLESEFINPVTININVGYGEVDGNSLGSNDLGESLWSQEVFETYSTVRNALVADGSPGASTLPTNSPDQGTLYISPAEAKGLGLLGNNGSIDGYVGFSSAANTFSYANGSAPPSNEYYFIGLVEHEITEDMGRISLLDEPNTYSVTDIFRFSSPGIHDTTPAGNGSTAYFSINNGAANLGSWNNNPSNGDLADWYGNNIPNGGDDAFDDYSPSGVVNVLSSNDITLMEALGWNTPPPPPSTPAGTSADMIIRNGGNGDYEIYDIGSNTILAAFALGQVGLEWQVAGLGGFNGSDTTDMIIRQSNTGVFGLYDISNSQITGFAPLGQAGLAWTVSGFGDFSSRAGETDMLIQNGDTGAFELYDIQNNAITSAASIGQVGLDWTVAGFGDFSGNANETDMLMRNSNTGVLELFDISHNTVTSAVPLGQVGLEWTVAGFGDFSGNPGESDMLMRQSNTGVLEIFDISHNTITSAVPLGQVGLEWQFSGFGDLSGKANETDMLMQNSNTGAFEFFDISHNTITSAGSMGQVGTEWQVSGIAADPPTGASTAQLVQAMASFGGSTAINIAPSAPLGADTSHQTLLTTPQHW